MSDEQIREAIAKAGELVAEAPTDLREVAFRVVLERLIEEGGVQKETTPAAPPSGDAPASRASSMTINELLVAARVSTHVERVTAIAYHDLTSGGVGVTSDEFTEAYSRARTRKPQNFADVIGTAVRRGWLIDGERKNGAKTWVITDMGERFIQGQLSKPSDV